MPTDTAPIARRYFAHVETRPADGTRAWDRRGTRSGPTADGVNRKALRLAESLAVTEWDGMLVRVVYADGSPSSTRLGQRAA